MLHEFKLRRSVSEATQNIKMAWGEDSANEHTVRRWYQKFRVGDVDLEDKDRSGRPTKCEDGRLKERVEADSRGTVREMGRELQAYGPGAFIAAGPLDNAIHANGTCHPQQPSFMHFPSSIGLETALAARCFRTQQSRDERDTALG
ncbi:unnamed protein product [Heligmosomoides polygyrus]|uniref:HTH_48 domain-containing protein n=1 Tax=Heligmosomoides polygyrus TaxID=6339 RepID=A0A3P7XQN0_HELPZ|nr:unnamed protein product [Heligmosomoides polygyrus]